MNPSTLTETAFLRSLRNIGDEEAAAWLKTMSTPFAAFFTVSKSLMSPFIISILPFTAEILSIFPSEKLSRTTTVWPSPTRRSTRLLPMKPAPPVTRIDNFFESFSFLI